jgi:hypothetical protein
MEWHNTLISIYCMICDLWKQGLDLTCARMSPNQFYELTDQEIITIYLFGVTEGRTEVKEIYDFTSRYLPGWFPRLGSYKTFNNRLNQIHECFPNLSEMLAASLFEDIAGEEKRILLIDSMPIVMAKGHRSGRAKVAREFANKGYCSSKDMYFHGVKLHIIGCHMPNTLPAPSVVALAPANEHDLTVGRPMLLNLHNVDMYADKAYKEEQLVKILQERNNTNIYTPIKVSKERKRLDFGEQLYSAAVSSVRQPIESLNNWLIEKTGIQIASKVRSYKGLVVHVFGKLAAALIMLPLVYQKAKAS